MRPAKHRRTTALCCLPFYTHLSEPFYLQYKYISTLNDHMRSYLIVTLLSHSVSYLISKLVLYLLWTFSSSTSTSLDSSLPTAYLLAPDAAISSCFVLAVSTRSVYSAHLLTASVFINVLTFLLPSILWLTLYHILSTSLLLNYLLLYFSSWKHSDISVSVYCYNYFASL